MKYRLSTLCALMAPVLLLAACVETPRMPENETPGAADREWTALTSSEARPQRAPGENSLAYFMRQVELADIRRRERGLAFWEAHPQDPRRYKWLMLTVHMPPHYARDIRVWANNEVRPEPNAAAVDVGKLAAWQARYPQLRAEFWGAPQVTDLERRFLWFGELEQGMWRAREAHARGEAVDTTTLLEGVVSFLEKYPEPFDESDASNYYWVTRTLIDFTIEDHQTFGWNAASLLSYATRLVATGPIAAESSAKAVKAAIETSGQLPTVRYSLMLNVSDSASGLTDAQRAWWELPPYPGDQPSTPEMRVIFTHDQMVQTRKYRDMGVELWRRCPDRQQQLTWIDKTHWDFPAYALHFEDAIWQRSVDWLAPVAIDVEAAEAWSRTYAALREEIWNDPLITGEQRGQILGKEVWEAYWQLQTDWRTAPNERALNRLLTDIHRLYTEFGNVRDASLFSTALIRDYRKYGMDADRLLAFFKPMLGYADEELRQLGQAAYNQIELQHTPFALKAPTLAGDTFDLTQLRGSIVLVDHWSTSCSSCIAAMPRIHDIYLKYKARGFSVVSVCYDGAENRRKVEKAEKEMNLTWTTLAGDGLWEAISTRYGYQGVPQYMLLNRDGTLYAGTGEVDMGRNLEALLEKMLAAD